MNVEELKSHIHRELFGERFPGESEGFDLLTKINAGKARQKEAIMSQAVKIMWRHGQTRRDILFMLREKFLLSKKQANEFLNHVYKEAAGERKEVERT